MADDASPSEESSIPEKRNDPPDSGQAPPVPPPTSFQYDSSGSHRWAKDIDSRPTTFVYRPPAAEHGPAEHPSVKQPSEEQVSAEQASAGQEPAGQQPARKEPAGQESPEQRPASKSKRRRKSQHLPATCLADSAAQSVTFLYDLHELLARPDATGGEFWRLMTEGKFCKDRWTYFAGEAARHWGRVVDGEEVLQEAELRLGKILLRKADPHAWLGKAREPVAYACGVIKNLCLGEAKRLRRREAKEGGPRDCERVSVYKVLESLPFPDDDLADEEAARLLLAQLPPRIAEELKLRAEDCTLEQIAAAKGVTVKIVRTDLKKAAGPAKHFFPPEH